MHKGEKMKRKLMTISTAVMATVLSGCSGFEVPKNATIETNDSFEIAYTDTWGVSAKKFYPKKVYHHQFGDYGVTANYNYEVTKNDTDKQIAYITLKDKKIDYSHVNQFGDISVIQAANDYFAKQEAVVKNGDYEFNFHEGYRVIIESNESKSELENNLTDSLKLKACGTSSPDMLGQIKKGAYTIYIRSPEYYKNNNKGVAEFFVDVKSKRTAKEETFSKTELVDMLKGAAKGNKVLVNGLLSIAKQSGSCIVGSSYVYESSYVPLNIKM